MKILGLSLSSDTHASLLVDGEIKSCVGEERLARIKNYTGFPYRAIEEVLKLESISPSEIDLVTVGFKDYMTIQDPLDIEILMKRGGDIDFSNEKPWWYRRSIIASSINGDFKRLFSIKDNRPSFGDAIRVKLNDMGINAPIKMVEHHIAHALSAYYFSNKRKNLVITADGYGDGLSGAVYKGEDGQLSQLYQTPKLHSLGVFYAAATKFLGFRSHRHEGKLTGLAAYGDANVLYDNFSNIISYDSNSKQIEFNLKKLGYGSRYIRRIKTYWRLINGTYLPGDLTHPLLNYFGRVAKNASKEDVSAATQKIFEEIYIKYFSDMIKETGLTDLAVAGGNFANVKLNQRILEETGATSITIHPNMGDGGVAIGSAIYHHLVDEREKGKPYEPRRLRNVYLGNDIDIKEFIAEAKKENFYIEQYGDSSKKVAELIAKGFIVGRISGKMEYGPRALGNRSIIAHPFNKNINDDLNKRLTRTEFMPFAPSVVKDKASKYYKNAVSAEYPGEFMTITLDVKKEGSQAEAVNHVDNTARPHFVDSENNPEFHKVLLEFEKLSGFPIVINTSFNKHEEPIVRSALDGLERLKDDSVQYLAVGNIIVSKNKNIESYQDAIPMLK
tara:strand:- start:6814 stop:8658 length:1845 start_codon:yes stop_codon:yes gene_type:complete